MITPKVFLWRGTGGGRPGEKGTGGVREAEEKGKITQHCANFAIEIMQRGGSKQIKGGNRDLSVQETGDLSPLSPPPPPATFLSRAPYQAKT